MGKSDSDIVKTHQPETTATGPAKHPALYDHFAIVNVTLVVGKALKRDYLLQGLSPFLTFYSNCRGWSVHTGCCLSHSQVRTEDESKLATSWGTHPRPSSPTKC